MGPGASDPRATRALMSGLLRVVRRLGTSTSMTEMLVGITQGVVEALGFEVAVIAVRTAQATLRNAAVVGPSGTERLLGEEVPVSIWQDLIEASERFGSLCHLMLDANWKRRVDAAGVVTWSPELVLSGDPDAWQPDEALFAPLIGPDGALVGVLSVDLPVNGRRPEPEQLELLELFAAEATSAILEAQREAELVDRENLYRAIFDRAPIPMAVLDENLALLRTNDAFSLLTRQRLEPPAVLSDIVAVEDVERVTGACHALLAGEMLACSIEHRLASVDGSPQWANTRVRRIDAPSSASRLVLALEDVTDSRAALDELRFRAEHDPLTGLANKSAAHQNVEDLLAGARPGATVAALFCDLDGFKQVNDTFGHAIGDALLTRVAQRLDRVLRGTDRLHRVGGDEFLVLCGPIPDEQAAVAVARRLLESLASPFAVDGELLRVTMSIGLATSVDRHLAPGLLVEAADRALYQAKAAGGSSLCVAGAVSSSAPRRPFSAGSSPEAPIVRVGQVRLRIAGLDDVAAIVDLVESAYRGELSREGWTTEADLLDGQRTDHDAVVAEIMQPRSALVLAELEGDLVGCCQLTAEGPGRASFGLFAVRPSLQGRGLGRLLLGEIERRARDELGASALELKVIRQRDDLVAWYRRLGFQPTGERVPFPYGDARFGVPRRQGLEFVVLAKTLVPPLAPRQSGS